jgi:hypothetical protein
VIRFAWLQARNQTLVAYVLLAALGVAAIVTGIQLSHVYDNLVAHCQTSCGLATERYLSHDSFMDKTLDILARAVPALLGLFWGAPLLAREFETGTYRLAWTQSVPRHRWLLVRIGIGALATLTLAGLFSLTVTWWYSSRDKIGSNVYDVFDRRDIAPIAYALFAFAAGVMFGALIRRTVPAMAATLGLFVFARIAVAIWIRPHLLAAKHVIVTLARQGPVQLGVGTSNGGPIQIFAQGGGPANSWTQSSHFVTRSGQNVSSSELAAFLRHSCASLLNLAPPQSPGVAKVPPNDPGAACLDHVSRTFRLAVAYQPAGRYWLFQWLEAGIFVVLSALAVAVTYWVVTAKRR